MADSPLASLALWLMAMSFLLYARERARGERAISYTLFRCLHCFPGRVSQVISSDDVETGLGQNLFAEFHVRAFQPHDQRYCQFHLLGRFDHAGGNHVTTHNATEYIDH